MSVKHQNHSNSDGRKPHLSDKLQNHANNSDGKKPSAAATAAATAGLSDAFLFCPVCNNEFNTPKVLPCLHSFCYECLESSLSQSEIGPGQAFLCPICKTQCVVPARGVRAMKSNIFLVTLQEFFQNKQLEQDQM